MPSFDDLYAPSGDVAPMSADTLAQFQDRVPAILLDRWKRPGIGVLGGGRLQLIDPADYEPVLDQWLGRPDPTRVPFALGAFGDLFYYRDRGQHDIGGTVMKVEDICRLDPHYRRTEVCTWEVDKFFKSYLLDEAVVNGTLRGPLFKEALAEMGALEPGEIFTFVPALALGGAEELSYLQKVDARVHLDFLFQATA